MSRSRRELLRLGAATAVVALMPGRRTEAAVVRVSALDRAARKAVLADEPFLTRSVLNGQLNTYFQVGGRKSASFLELVAVNDLASAAATGTVGSELSFSAVFRGPAKTRLAQQTYPLQHRMLGKLSVFLVPVGPASRLQDYEAVFYRPEA
jgi:Domain of unknown function (DUF6916)